MHFNHFKLKRLIATGYTCGTGSLTNNFLATLAESVHKIYYLDIHKVSSKLSNSFTDNANRELSNYDSLKGLRQEGLIRELEGDGDFRSDECIALLQEADVVVTNPPFSLFREYVAQLMEYHKEFLMIGNQNAITYKEVFKFIKEDKIWLGFSHPKEFIQSNGLSKKFGNVCWFTNLPISKRNEELILYKTYKGMRTNILNMTTTMP